MIPKDCTTFYNRMREGTVPHTSQMTLYEFVDFWTKLLEKLNLPIVHIAMGSGISGTFSSAIIARSLFLNAHPEA